MSSIWQDIKAAISGSEEDYTKVNIKRAVILLAIPMVLEMFMESIFAIVDIFFVSKISVEAVATVGLTESVLTLFYSLAIGLTTAAAATVARRIGEKDPDRAAIAAAQSVNIGIAISVILGVLGFIYAEHVLELMGAEPEVVTKGADFTRILFASNIVIMLIFLLNGIFRGAGDASLAMKTLIISNGINIVLDPCLIFGLGPFPALGLKGAAIATVIGRGIGVVFQLCHLFGKRCVVQLARRHFLPIWNIIGNLIKISGGSVFQFLIASASWIVMMKVMADFGSQALAGYTIAVRIIIFCILPAWGISNAAATLVGQSLGAEQPHRAEKSVWVATQYATTFLLGLALIFFFFADATIGLFNSDPSVVSIGAEGLKIFCIGYVFFASGMVVTAAFNGAGDTYTPMVINIICFWLMQIPLAYLLAKHMGWGTEGVFWAVTISETTLAVIAIFWFRKGRWKTVQI